MGFDVDWGASADCELVASWDVVEYAVCETFCLAGPSDRATIKQIMANTTAPIKVTRRHPLTSEGAGFGLNGLLLVAPSLWVGSKPSRWGCFCSFGSAAGIGGGGAAASGLFVCEVSGCGCGVSAAKLGWPVSLRFVDSLSGARAVPLPGTAEATFRLAGIGGGSSISNRGRALAAFRCLAASSSISPGQSFPSAIYRRPSSARIHEAGLTIVHLTLQRAKDDVAMALARRGERAS